MPRLRRSDCHTPGYTRRRAGRGFIYVDQNGNRVTDAATLERIRALVLPPAWEQVWICTAPNGHIQATGVDARGRTQYRYHDAWRVARDREKFDHMLEFGRALPLIRERVADHMAGDSLGRERVLACAIRLLDLGFFRIGGDSYAEENQTYGIATMLKKHVQVHDCTVSFDFMAKGSKRCLQTVVDPAVADVVAALKRRRGGGTELIAYRDQGGRWIDVHSEDINEFVREIAGLSCSAKDFRTWNATVLAAVALAVSTQAKSASARKRCIRRAMTEVAHYLGNTPAVVRSSYVDPRVIDRYIHGETIVAAVESLGTGVEFGHPSTHGAAEAAVLDLLDPEAPSQSGQSLLLTA